MKYISEFRDKRVAAALAAALAAEADPARDYSLMEFCGGHTHPIFPFAIHALPPPHRAPGARPGLPGVCPPYRTSRHGD